MARLERRYAEALADVGEAGYMEELKNDMEEVSNVYMKIPEFRDTLINAGIKKEIKKELIDAAFGRKIRKEIINLLKVLVDKGRIKYLPEIKDDFVKIADARRNILNMKIITAVPLDLQQIDNIKLKYKARYNAVDVRAENIIDSRMVGGIKVIIGDRVEDASLKTRLEGMKKALLN
mgnify:CR=1 FL=1